MSNPVTQDAELIYSTKQQIAESFTEAISTKLTQETVDQLDDANVIFGAKQGGGTPIVVTPRRTGKANKLALSGGVFMAFGGLFFSQIPGLDTIFYTLAFSSFGLVTYWPVMLLLFFIGFYPLVVFKIPSGVFAMMTKYGKYVGVFEAGRHFLPPYFKVAYMVTRQSTAYNAPVKNCPTNDNVMVKVDLLLVFNIEDPEKFVYKLGAEKFGDLLASTAEEGIRGLVRSVKHDQAYELRGGGAGDMLSSLNDIFSSFGVIFTQATITNVVLPPDLAEALENQTVYEAKKSEQERRQDYELKVLNDREALARQELNKKNERLAADEAAKKERELILRESAEVESLKKKRLAEIDAEQRANVKAIETEAELKAAEVRERVLEMEVKRKNERLVADEIAKKEREAVIRESAEIEAQRNASVAKIEAEQEAAEELIRAKAKLEAAETRAAALRTESEAEGQASEHLAKRRKHELEIQRLKVLESLAANNKVVISGNNGDNLIAQITAAGRAADVMATSAFAETQDAEIVQS